MYPNSGIIVKMNQAIVMNAIRQLIIQPIHLLMLEDDLWAGYPPRQTTCKWAKVDGRCLHPWMCVIDCSCSTSKEPKTAWSKW